MPKGRLIAFRADRLGARLIALVNAMRLAERLDVRFVMYWPESADIGQVFNDPTVLFDAEFVGRHFIAPSEWKLARGKARRWLDLAREGEDAIAAHLADGGDVLIDQAFDVQSLPGETPQAARAGFVKAAETLPFAPDLTPRLRMVEHRLKGATAYHIRRGDITTALKARNKAWPAKLIPDEIYMAHMEREAERASSVILFSDSPALLERFRARFPAFRTIADVVSTDMLEPGARDLFELYAMSRCARIIAPEHSAFSSTAADLGGAEKIDVTGDLPPEAREAALTALVERLETRPESFENEGEIGQCLVHAEAFLDERGERARWRALLLAYDRREIGLSYLYPRLQGLLAETVDLAASEESRARMMGGGLVFPKDFAEAEALCGVIHYLAGDAATGRTRIVNAAVHHPRARALERALGILVEAGELDEENFLPLCPVALTDRRQPASRGAMKGWPAALAETVGLEVGGPEHTLPSLHALLWDWLVLLRGANDSALPPERFARALANRIGRAGPSPEGESLVALFDVLYGDAAAGRDALAALAVRHFDNATVQHRLALAQRATGAREAALEAARTAHRLEPLPGRAALAGLMAHELRQMDVAAPYLEEADAALPIATLPALLADIARRRGDPETALALANRAVALAPHDTAFRQDQAELLDALGHAEQARDSLMEIFKMERASFKTICSLAELCRRTDRADLALEVIGYGLARKPEHPRLIDLRSAALSA